MIRPTPERRCGSCWKALAASWRWFPWLAAGPVAYFLVSQLLAAAPGWAHLSQPKWSWLVVAVVAMVATHGMGAVALSGAAPERLPSRQTFAVQFMVSFTNRLAPSSVGGMVTSAWYLRRCGIARNAAVAAVASVSLASFVVHLLATGAALAWGGPSLWGRLGARSWGTWALYVAAVVAGAVVVAGAATGRHRSWKLAGWCRDTVGQFRNLVISPRRMSRLVGGASGVTASYAVAFWACLRAFGVGLGLLEVAVAFLAASAVAAATPTPGGLGSTEAALIALSTALGGAQTQVVAAVLAYRLVTYWLPVVPGAAAFVLLRRRLGPADHTPPERAAPAVPGGDNRFGGWPVLVAAGD